jgi:hypothetical protein
MITDVKQYLEYVNSKMTQLTNGQLISSLANLFEYARTHPDSEYYMRISAATDALGREMARRSGTP